MRQTSPLAEGRGEPNTCNLVGLWSGRAQLVCGHRTGQGNGARNRSNRGAPAVEWVMRGRPHLSHGTGGGTCG